MTLSDSGTAASGIIRTAPSALGDEYAEVTGEAVGVNGTQQGLQTLAVLQRLGAGSVSSGFNIVGSAALDEIFDTSGLSQTLRERRIQTLSKIFR